MSGYGKEAMSDTDAKTDRIDALYEQHRRGVALSQSEWLYVDRILKLAAQDQVLHCATRYKIPESTHGELILAVAHSLFAKFLKKVPDPRNGSLRAMLKTMAFHATITELRRIRGVMAAQFDGYERKRSAPVMPATTGPAFYEALRAHLPPPRFWEWGLTREILIAHAAMTGKLPDARAIRGVVPPDLLNTVYNAAVVEINRATEKWGSGE